MKEPVLSNFSKETVKWYQQVLQSLGNKIINEERSGNFEEASLLKEDYEILQIRINDYLDRG